MHTHFFKTLLCKLFLYSFVLSSCLSFAQSYPLPQSLPVKVNFGPTHFTSLPAGFQMWIAPLCQTTNANLPQKIPLPIKDTALRAEVSIAQASFGFYSYLSTGKAKLYMQITSLWTGQVVAAINTKGHEQIAFSCALSSFGNNTRYAGLVFEYMIPPSETWLRYGFYKLKDIKTDTVLRFSLPGECDNRACVYLRMASYRSNVTGESGGSVMPLLLDALCIEGKTIDEDTLESPRDSLELIPLPCDSVQIIKDTLYIKADTVYLGIIGDSTYVELPKDTVFLKSDTVFINVVRDSIHILYDTVYHDRFDTIYIYKDTLFIPCDTIKIPVDTIVPPDTLVPLAACLLPFIFPKDSGRFSIPAVLGFYEKGLGNDYAPPTRLRFDNTDDYVLLHYQDTADVLTYDIKWNANSSPTWGAFVLEVSTDGKQYTVLRNYAAGSEHAFNSGTLRKEKIESIPIDTRYIRWRYSQRIDGNIGLGNIYLEKYQKESEVRQEKAIDAEVKIYPNPSHGIFTIESAQILWIEIYSLTGHRILTREVRGKVDLDLASCGKGIFFIRIVSPLKNQAQIKKIIVF